MKIKFIIGILISTFICATAFCSEELEQPQIVEAQIMDVPFYYSNKVVERIYPILAYDGHAYISLVDVSNALGKEATYSVRAFSDDVSMVAIGSSTREEGEWPISRELAMDIGKAVINNKYKDLVNDSTMYACATYYSIFDIQHMVTVKFNPTEENMIDNQDGNSFITGGNDLYVFIDADTGMFEIKETYEFKTNREMTN